MSKKTIALLSNVTVDLVAARLRKSYDFYLPEGFDTWVREVVDPSSGLHNCSADAIVALLDGTEARGWTDIAEARERLSLWKQALMQLASDFTAVPVFVTTIDIRVNRIRALAERTARYELESDWYEFVQSVAEKRTNVYVLDYADVVADAGRNTVYSNKMWYAGGMPWSRDGLTLVARQIERALAAAFNPRKKVIALDLDNTLWGGIVGEDGVEGIELSDHKEGQRYYDFQRQLKEMGKRGTVLGIVSKNNPEDAEAAIQGHPSMLLRDEDFASEKINWEDKPTNLKAMSVELNITEGGFMFVDDNPAEREVVKGECPEVTVPEFPVDTSELLPFAEELWLDYCQPLRVLEEDLTKTQMYKAEANRRQELSSSLNLDDYLAKLEMEVDIHRMRPEELERVVQLCNKTNQFNLTTKRYTMAQIQELASDPANAIYVAYVSDRYGNSGLVSVIILLGEGDDTRIDTFLMSCRVMGRKVEDVIVNEVSATCGGKLIGEFVPTAKNKPVEALYDRLGFALILKRDNGSKVYELDARSYERRSAVVFKQISFEGEEVRS